MSHTPNLSASHGGLLLQQAYLDTFFDDVEELPYPTGEDFDAAVDKLNEQVDAILDEALASARKKLSRIGVRLVVCPR